MSAFRRTALAALAAGIFSLASAPVLADTVYECEIKQKATNGTWLPEIVVVVLDDARPEALVFDPIIKYFMKDPIPATIDTDNSKRITLAWEVKGKSGTNQPVRLRYRLTILKAGLKASMTGSPLGYADEFASSGTCKKSKQ